MGLHSPFKHHHQPQNVSLLLKKLLPWTFYAILPVAIFRLYFYPLSFPQSPIPETSPILISSSPSLASSPQAQPQERRSEERNACDYTNGKWVLDNLGPLYNGTTCGTIKDGQNCIAHGRPDLGYLYWRWKPQECNLPRFEPNKFLQIFRNKHIAFVGDSMARNQLESLLCMLSIVSSHQLVYTSGDDNKFRRWHFGTHNINVSVYWSPFLVKGVEKSSNEEPYNKLYVDSIDEKWAGDLNGIDMVLMSVGHWFLHPAVYFEGGSVLGCHYCTGLNHTEIGFYDALKKALRTTLKTIVDRTRTNNRHLGVFLTTFSPHHFEGEWDKFGACPKSRPYEEGEKSLEGMDAEMREIEVGEIESAKSSYAKDISGIKIEALDITKLALLRPDGHPGPYMYPFPFADGVKDRVQNDCVHWCLPGPIDTWNEILLEVIKRWEGEDQARRR